MKKQLSRQFSGFRKQLFGEKSKSSSGMESSEALADTPQPADTAAPAAAEPLPVILSPDAPASPPLNDDPPQPASPLDYYKRASPITVTEETSPEERAKAAAEAKAAEEARAAAAERAKVLAAAEAAAVPEAKTEAPKTPPPKTPPPMVQPAAEPAAEAAAATPLLPADNVVTDSSAAALSEAPAKSATSLTLLEWLALIAWLSLLAFGLYQIFAAEWTAPVPPPVVPAPRKLCVGPLCIRLPN